MKRVVLLIDSKIRDLPVAALIDHHLSKLNVECFLQPLESYRSALEALRPHMIIFNHLTASHLADYSRRLRDMGVKTAVLINEGILYDEGELEFNAGCFHTDAHTDEYFCWNEVHGDALKQTLGDKIGRISVVGVPRFDYYFPPWSLKFEKMKGHQHPIVLLCTNFQVASYWERPREEAAKSFAGWIDRVPMWENYWEAVEDSYKGRQKLFSFLDSLVKANRYHLILRPHPREDDAIYRKWLQQLPAKLKENVTLDRNSNISSLILSCDVEVSCETCTTALESWIAGKPTIELIFERNPLWFHEEHAASNVLCEDPDKFVKTIDGVLQGTDPEIMEQREEHLRRWCYKNDGAASQRVAEIIADSVRDTDEPDWSQLSWTDYRRGYKQRILNAFNKPSHYNPLHLLRYHFNSGKYTQKYYDIQKSVVPSDIKKARAELVALSHKLDSSAQ